MKKVYSGAAALGHELERERQKRGISYGALGRRAEVDPSQAFRICHGEFKALSHNVVRICNVLDVRPASEDLRSPPTKGNEVANQLLEELMANWDRTPEDARRLLDMLKALRKFRSKPSVVTHEQTQRARPFLR